ncbi:amino acid adenylation domain-containing protein [Streptomyces sp. BHT-5-2]|uniref:non-ribosomal peptide synthetase n=1 Tax=Streptomyces sp. BHT-5-2 TaxID=2866715 RepID=UPI001C8DE440|nr:non-ribosomal peptide synthetase [Streptomyces sp. BHT-5-2]QZL04347.1 amino acid adenylation domain-containing protein [Streptomyces sp. BHT-5-2]
MSADTCLSSAQQRLWFVWQLRPDGNEYNVPRATRLRGALDVGALRRAIDRLVARHDALRASFPTVAGAPVLRIAAEMSVPLPLTDLSALPTAEREAALGEAVARAALAPFDLESGPVLRTELIRLAPDDHALVLTFHHIAVDGWSMGIIDRELSALYAAMVADGDDPLPAPGRSYRDCVAAERRLLEGPRRHEALDHWRAELAGAPLELALPTDRPHPAAPSFAGDSRAFPFSPELAEHVDAVAARYRVTRFITLLSGYAALLSRMTSAPDLVIGVPVSGRTEMEVEGTVGLFVNMLPLHVRCTADTTFGTLLHQVRDTFLAGHEYQDLPFQLLVEEVQPDRSTARHPLFQTVVTYEDLPGEGTALPGLDTSPLPVPTRTAKYELALHLAGNRQRTEAWVGYQTDVFDGRSAELIGERYLRLLSAALAAPDTPVSRLPVLGSEEERMLLTDWAGAPERAARPPVRERVDRLVERQARAHPDAVAVRSDEGTLTYAELDRAADLIAAGLRAAGAGPGTLVATCLPRGADLVTTQLGVLKSGAAYVSLDPAHPASRLTAILAEARPLLALTDPEHRAALECERVETLNSLRSGEDSADSADDPPVAPAGLDDLAYVMYTSGSTGRPKGVLVEHRALANLVTWHRAEFGIGPGDRGTLIAAPGFDASVWETWSALTAGATLEVPAAETVLSPPELRSWLTERRITSAFLPTPLLERMTQDPWPAGSVLRSVLTGGDRLRGTGRHPLPFRLVNNYGPTESTVVATSGTVPADGGERDTLPGIGRPIAGAEVYVLDAELRPVPVGVPGELYLGGATLARGYLGQPALTADRFVPHPYSRVPGARLYRTGDLVRWRTDAGLDFLGRNDHQVKIRGIRVEPGEIENVLRAHPDVRDAVVTVVSPDGTAEPELAAYLVPVDASGTPDLAALHDHTTRHLPRHMHPRRYLLLPSVPLTANGKVDRTALAGAARELAPPSAAAHRRARTPLERLISDVWARALGHESFGTDDNFFDAGGHSLLLASVRDRLAAELGTPVRIADLYAYPTIATLARQLSGAPGSTAGDRPAGRTGGVDGGAERRRRGAARLTAMRARTSYGRAERQ